MSNENSAIVNEFLIESFENLSTINEELTKYESNSEDKELLNSIFRKVHTLKGSASFLGYKKLQEVTHASENILDLIRSSELESTGHIIDVLLSSFDMCSEIVKSIEVEGKEPESSYAGIVAQLTGILNGDVGVSEDTPKVSIDKDQPVTEKMLSASSNDFDEPAAPDVVAVKTPLPDVKKKEIPDKKEKKITEAPAVKNIADSVVRVNVQLLDKIMNVVGELVLNRNQILQYAGGDDSPSLNRLAQQLNVITTELQTDIMTTRMQPVGSVLSKFERIVRDLARNQGKKIKMNLIGKETELDKTLLEAIRDPMTHLIRNSVDHGVESPEVRIENGKKEEGRIDIRSYHEGGQVTIEITDDGAGINEDKVIEKAISKGIITVEQAQAMSAKQKVNLIFTPGFSTADAVTDISGRGVGMDVVKSNIEKIGGSVDVISKMGKGSTFKLKIPLTLAIVPVLVVISRDETFAIPQVNLVELVRIEGGNDKGIERLHDSEFFRLRGDLVPIFRLNKELGLIEKREDAKEVEEVEEVEETEDDSANIVILSAEGRIFGLIVDRILDTEEIVVKPLSRELKKLSVYAGATIMGDGKVALIVDALGFFNMVDKGHSQKVEVLGEESQYVDDVESQEILLCRLADKRTYGIPLCLVNRLEEFKLSDVEWTGSQPLVRYGDLPMPLLNLESSLKLQGESILLKMESSEAKNIRCVVVYIRGNYLGFVVESILDIALTEGDVNSDTANREGLMGTAFVAGKTISIIDVYEVLDIQKISRNLPLGSDSSLKRGRILIVDDSPLFRKIEKEFFIENGFEVETANNGLEAYDRLKSESFDILITDIEMPTMNGFELARNVRKEEQKMPILGLTTRITKDRITESESVGMNYFLKKFNKEEILSIVDEIMS